MSSLTRGRRDGQPWQMCRKMDGEAKNPGPMHDPFAEFLEEIEDDDFDFGGGFGGDRREEVPKAVLSLDTLVPARPMLGCMSGLFPAWGPVPDGQPPVHDPRPGGWQLAFRSAYREGQAGQDGEGQGKG